MASALAYLADACPYFASTAQRDQRLPAPGLNQRCQVGERFYRYTGGGWVPSGALPRSAGYFVPREYGCAGDAVTDDTANLQACLTAAGARGFATVDLQGLVYKVTAPLSQPGAYVTWTNGRILKAHTGNLLDLTGNFARFRNVHFDADVGTSTTYGTSGAALHFTPNNAAYGCQWVGGAIQNIDRIFEFEQDAGHAFYCSNAFLQPYTVAPGSEPDAIWVKADTTAAFRMFTGIWFPGKFRLQGALDTVIVGSAIRSVLSDAACSILLIQGCVLANNGNPHSIAGDNVSIVGCRISGAMTLEANSDGAFIGNVFTSGALTNSSGGDENWNILHRVEDSLHRTWVGPHTLRIGQGASIVQACKTVYYNDVGANIYTTSPSTHIWNAPITADRTAVLNTGASMYNGERFRFVRTAAATGAFNVILGATGKTLAAGEWAEVEYDGAAYNVIAKGNGV